MSLKALIVVVLLVQYVFLFVVNPTGLGYVYAIILCATISLTSPYIGFVLWNCNMQANKYMLLAALNIYAASFSLYLALVRNPAWRIPVLLASVATVYLSKCRQEKTRIRSKTQWYMKTQV